MRYVITVLLALLPVSLWAEVTGVYEVQGGKTMELSYKDGDHMRMSMPGGQFMLVNGDNTYMVRKQNEQWVAIDMAAMGKMMQQMRKQGGGQSPGQGQPGSGDVDFRDTGRTETVAGYEGSVYEVTGPEGETSEIVLSDHEDIVALSRGWVEFTGNMTKQMGAVSEQMQDRMMSRSDIDKRGGILRAGDDMRIKSVSTDSKDSAYFELPEGTKVQDMSGMGGGMMQGR
jgi:hypothetical protein